MSTPGSEAEENPLDYITHYCLSDVGMRREENQDSFGVVETEAARFYIVADGMGGVQGGAIASSLAIDVAKAFLAEKNDISSGELRGAVGAANYAIFEKGLAEPSLAGMGTTFVGLCFSKGRLIVVNVGDSRAYLIRNNSIGQLTEDHTLISELLKSGAITEDQVANHPVAHMLTRSLGPTEDIEVDCSPVPEAPLPGDKFLLCSDGLYNHVSTDEIGEVVSTHSAEEAVAKLVALANDRGGSDNITVMVIEVGTQYHAPVADVEDTMELLENQSLAVSAEVDQDALESEEIESDIGELDTVEDLPAMNGSGKNGATHSDSPEIAPTVGGVSQERLIQQALEHAGRLREQTVTADNNKSRARISLTKCAVIILCVAGGTFGALYWYVQSPAGKQQLAENTTSVAGTVPVPAVDGAVFAAGADSQVGSKDTEDDTDATIQTEDGSLQELQKSNPSTDSKSSAVNAASAADDTVDSQPESSNQESIATVAPDSQPAIVSKMDKIREELHALEEQEAGIIRRIDSFSQPISGSTGLLLAEASRSLEDLKKESEAILVQLEDATKRLSVWYGQKQRLQSTQILTIASEVAELSPSVAEQKKIFEDVTWQFLKKREELQVDPDNEELKKDVDAFIEQRKEELKKLNQVVRDAVAEEMDVLDRKIAELTLAKEDLDRRSVIASEELEYVQALMSQDPKKQAASKARLNDQLTQVQKEKESLQALFTSLYEEITAIEPVQ